MGAGLLKAGALWAGHEIPAQGSVLVPLTDAPAYDPTKRAIPLDANGRAITVHWVDQYVSIALTIVLRWLKPLPNLGVDGDVLATVTADNAQATVENVVANALAPLIKQRAVTIDRVDVKRATGSLAYQVQYSNLLLPRASQRQKINIIGGVR